jgi:predicted ATPase
LARFDCRPKLVSSVIEQKHEGELMKIIKIEVDNFKSLVDFKLNLGRFGCLIGLNGSGKSTVIQFFDFLSQQIEGDLDGWLKQRHWDAPDINSKLTKKLNIEFRVLLEDEDGSSYEWVANFNRTGLRCTNERLVWNGQTLLKVERGVLSFYSTDGEKQSTVSGHIAFTYQGSVMSQLKEGQLSKPIRSFIQFFRNLHALDMLSPEQLRQKTRESKGTLGIGGERLSAFLHELGMEERKQLSEKLKKVYPHLEMIDTSSQRSGWKRLSIRENYNGIKLPTEARHINDGLLRLLAIFAQLDSDQSFLLLDEIENGINIELVEYLMDSLVQAESQVLVTTHSPLVLNYLDDDVAMGGVNYLYKSDDGITHAIRFFDIPSMRNKLEVMGPGEVYEDTSLTLLADEIATLLPED